MPPIIQGLSKLAQEYGASLPSSNQNRLASENENIVNETPQSLTAQAVAAMQKEVDLASKFAERSLNPTAKQGIADACAAIKKIIADLPGAVNRVLESPGDQVGFIESNSPDRDVGSG